MSESSAPEIAHGPSAGDMDVVLAAQRTGNLQVTHNDTAVEIHGVLGGGGTKTAYDVTIDGQPFALMLPNATDTAEKALEKWRIALHEPAATDRLREMGLLVNPICDEVEVNVGGRPFSAIRMRRYQDMPIQVRDGKNRTSSVVETDLFPESIDLDSFLKRTEGIRTDIRTLIENGVSIGRDSINICILDGELRLYLNDVAEARFEPIDPTKVYDYASFYEMLTIGALMNGMSHEEYARHKEFLDNYFGLNAPGHDRFSGLIVQELGRANVRPNQTYVIVGTVR